MNNQPTIKFNQWQGINTDNDPYEVGTGLTDAVNVEFTRAGKVRRRKGAHQIYQGVVKALWADGRGDALFLTDSELKAINIESGSVYTLQTGLTYSQTLTALRVQNRVFWSNGIENGCIELGHARSWGIEPPQGRPLIVSTGGSLFKGTYLVACAYVRDDGQVSGTSVSSAYELAEMGGLLIGEIPISSDPTIIKKHIYVSSANGEELYRAATIENDLNTVVFNDFALHEPLETQFKLPPPPCHDMCLFKGALFLATANMLISSDPYNYELFDPYNYIQFSSPIRVLGAVSDGLWVGTDDEIVFLQGTSMDTFNQIKRANHGAIQGSLAYSNASAVGQNGERMPDESVIFATDRGIMAGFPGGELRNLTQRQFTPGSGYSGTALIHDGHRYTLCYRTYLNRADAGVRLENIT